MECTGLHLAALLAVAVISCITLVPPPSITVSSKAKLKINDITLKTLNVKSPRLMMRAEGASALGLSIADDPIPNPFPTGLMAQDQGRCDTYRQLLEQHGIVAVYNVTPVPHYHLLSQLYGEYMLSHNPSRPALKKAVGDNRRIQLYIKTIQPTGVVGGITHGFIWHIVATAPGFATWENLMAWSSEYFTDSAALTGNAPNVETSFVKSFLHGVGHGKMIGTTLSNYQGCTTTFLTNPTEEGLHEVLGFCSQAPEEYMRVGCASGAYHYSLEHWTLSHALMHAPGGWMYPCNLPGLAYVEMCFYFSFRPATWYGANAQTLARIALSVRSAEHVTDLCLSNMPNDEVTRTCIQELSGSFFPLFDKMWTLKHTAYGPSLTQDQLQGICEETHPYSTTYPIFMCAWMFQFKVPPIRATPGNSSLVDWCSNFARPPPWGHDASGAYGRWQSCVSGALFNLNFVRSDEKALFSHALWDSTPDWRELKVDGLRLLTYCKRVGYVYWGCW